MSDGERLESIVCSLDPDCWNGLNLPGGIQMFEITISRAKNEG